MREFGGKRALAARASRGAVLATAIALLALAGVALTACGGVGGSSATASTASKHLEATSSSAVVSSGFASASLSVPAGNGAAPFNVPHVLRIPKGWSAEVWARVPEARFALWTPQHDLLVSAADSGEVVELLPGAKPSAKPRQRVLLTGLTMPQGMAFDTVNGVRVLYVAQSNQIDRYRWSSDGTLGLRTVVVADLPDMGPTGEDVHRLKSLTIGPDHTIYVSIGSASNAKAPEAGQLPPRATILSFAASGSHMRVVGRGVRNGEGLAFAPDGSLWTAVNERDEVPYPFHRSFGGIAEAFGHVIPAYVNEHPPDEIARLTSGRNLGWPYCNPDPDDTPGQPERGLHFANLGFVADAVTNPGEKVLDCAKLEPVERGLPAHSAPLGLTFLEGSAIASPWSGGAVLATHGSWDRTVPRAPALLWLPWKSRGRTLGEPVALVSGFQELTGARWGRPVDAVPGPEGALYVTDDQAGAVYRFAPRAR
jgi:glucose/arabinose dehydrogenase